MSRFSALFPHPWPLIGVVHLRPLPGSPGNAEPLSSILEVARSDATILAETGFDGIIVENFGDAPFMPDQVEPHTIVAMTLAVTEVANAAAEAAGRMDRRPPAIGVNVLRNDARSALAIAAVTGAGFIRVNVHCGAMVTDQGLIQGKAHETLRYRHALGARRVAILADVLVKHATPLGAVDLKGAAKDTWLRGKADGLVLSGRGTGEPTDLVSAAQVRQALPGARLLQGSGLTLETLQASMGSFSGAIVGTSIKVDGQVENRIDPLRALELVSTRDGFYIQAAERPGPEYGPTGA